VLKSSIFIVGGGTSLKGFDFQRLKDVNTIVTNCAIFDVPEANYFITVDYTFISKVRSRLVDFHRLNVSKIFVANLGHPDLAEAKGAVHDIRCGLVYDLCDYDIIIKSRYQEGIGTTFREFKTGDNSGFCALQLAVLLGYTNIYLLGIDLVVTRNTHYHNEYIRMPTGQKQFVEKLCHYDKLFRIGIEQLKKKRPECNVVSCSDISSLNDIIAYIPLEKVLC